MCLLRILLNSSQYCIWCLSVVFAIRRSKKINNQEGFQFKLTGDKFYGFQGLISQQPYDVVVSTCALAFINYNFIPL